MVLNGESSWKQPEEVLIHTVMSPKFLCLSKFRCSCSDRQLLRSSGKEGGAKQHDSIFPYQGIFGNFGHLTDKLCLIREDCGEGWVNWPATWNWLNCSLFLNTEERRALKIFCQERFLLISLPHSHDSVNERDSTQGEEVPPRSSKHKEMDLQKHICNSVYSNGLYSSYHCMRESTKLL